MHATPTDNIVPVAEFLTFTAQEQSLLGLLHCEDAGGPPCSMSVEVGLFFDGTNNNMERDLKGRRVPVPFSEKKRRQAEREGEPTEPAPLPNKPIKPQECSHTNVVKLFNAFVGNQQPKGCFRYYIPGVGTEFKEIGELAESQKGKAFADGGQERITWGLLQVLNALHLTCTGGELPLYKDDPAGQLAQAYDKAVGQPEADVFGEQPPKPLTHRDWFAPHIAKLKAKVAAKPKPTITRLNVSVFGFSRGAAQAVAFCHLFHDLLDDGKLAGVPAGIRFVGLFDTVASVGGSASMSKTLPLPKRIFDGHWAWGAHILKPLPPSVANGLHLIASHELRMNFPVTHQQGNIREVLFPGVHSDIGGGYAPGTQGKGRGGQKALLSQIPLAHMYKAARLAGVPLIPYSELPPRDKLDFDIDSSLASAWEAYLKELGEGGDRFERHMELYYRWRAARLNNLEETASFKAADAQEQEDLRSSNRMLAGDLEALRARKNMQGWTPDYPRSQSFSHGDTKRINHWQFYRAQNAYPLDEWERWALEVFENPKPLPPEVMRFFDDYVHDSFAGFYMAGEVTEFDKRAKVAEVMEKKPEDRNRFERKIAEITEKTLNAGGKKFVGLPLNEEEQALLKQAEHDTPYPLMTDDDAPEIRNPLVTTQTYTRREGGGYVIHRGRYPEKGFQLRGTKAKVVEKASGEKKATEKEAEFAWRNAAGVTEKPAPVVETPSATT